MTDRRWILTLTYRTDAGPVDVEHSVEELSGIHALVERGPHWDTLIRGSFRINPTRLTAPGLTVETAAEM